MLICKEDLLKDISETVLFSGRLDHVSAEMRGASKVMERVRVAPAVSESPSDSKGCKLCNSNRLEAVGFDDHGVYLSCGSSRPPENEKFRFCPSCGKKL